MAIQYVGSNTGTWLGATTGSNTISLTALTGGIASAAAIGDLVVAVYSTGSSANRTLSITTGYTIVVAQLYSNGTTYDTNLRVAYKYLTAADTTVTFGPTGAGQDAGTATVHVFRGVDATTPLDVPGLGSTGTNTGRPSFASITPVTSGAFIIAAGAGAAGTGAVYTTATLSGFRSVTSADTNDAMLGVGYIEWTGGTYSPAQFGGGTTNAADSWASRTIALRPASQTASITESVTATDAVSNADNIWAPTADESVNALDAQTSSISYDVDITETVSATDAQDAATAAKNVDITESVTATDSQDAVTPANADITETVSASDAETAINDAYASITESVTATDTQDGSVLADAAITESVTATETETANFATDASQTESVTATDSETGSVDLTASQSESVTATDSETSQLDANASITESANALDSESASKEYNVDEAESVTATDAQIAGLAQDVLQDETVTATETQTFTSTSGAVITETVTASDAETAVNTARAWINEGGAQFNTTYGFSVDTGLGGYGSVTNLRIAQSFIANQSGVIGNVTLYTARNNTTAPLPTSDGAVEIWQLASNSITAAPQTLLASIPLNFSSIPTSRGNVNYYFGNVSVTAGVGYAIVMRDPADATLSTQYLDLRVLSPTSSPFYEYNYARTYTGPLRLSTNGTTWSSSNYVQRFFVSIIAATDAETGGFTAAAAQNESVTATDAEDAALDYAVDITETATATDTEDGIVAFNSFVTESVTASDTETAVDTARAWITEANNAPLVATNIFSSATYSNFSLAVGSTVARGLNFIANQSTDLGQVTLRASRANTAAALPTQPGTLELWKLSTNTLSGTPQTLLASISFSLGNITTNTDILTALDFTGVTGASITSGLGYAIVLRAGSDWTLSTQYLRWNGGNTTFGRNGLDYFNNFYVSTQATTGANWSNLNQDSQYQIAIQPPTATLDTQLPGLAYQVAQDEAALALDSEDAVFALPVDITETVTATDNEDSNAAMGVAQDEAVTATDSEEANTPQNAAQDESVTATDTETTTADYAVNQTETVTATDTETVNYSTAAAITESVTATESNVVYVDFTAAITETLSLTDSQSVVAVLPVSITEAVAANDSCVAESSAIFTVTGVQGTTQLGTAAVATDQILSVTGVQATGYLGTATTTGAAVVNLTGVYGTGQLGTASVVLSSQINVTGVTAQGAVGTVALVTNNFINVTGVQGATQLGTATSSVAITINVTGVQATSAVGSVSVIIGQFVNVSGVQANIILNKVNVWGDIVPTPTGPWSNVNDSQTNNWVIIDKAA